MTLSIPRGLSQWPGLLLLTLFGALVLPMLPVWQGAIRVLAGLVLLAGLRQTPRARSLIGGVLILAWATSLYYWAQSFLATPAGHVIASLTDTYGQPLGLLPDGLLLLSDTVCLVGLLHILRRHALQQHVYLFASAWMLFWSAGLLTVLSQGIGVQINAHAFAQMMTGLSGWATWLYWAFLALLLLRDSETRQTALQTIGLAGAVIGGIIASQWMFGDFSYMISGHGSGTSSFNRVRGTDYYHAPATFAVVLGCLALFGMQHVRRHIGWLFTAIALAAIVAINNTRGISLACAAGLAISLASALYTRRWFASACLIGALAVTLPNIVYLKPTFESTQTSTSSTPESVSTHQMTSANEPRAILGREGMNMLRARPLLGMGVGTLEIPLEGNAFNGLTSTYSSHTLYLDIAMMGGILALAGFLAALALAVKGALGSVFKRSEDANTAATALTLLTAYAAAWLFLPQERNELIGVAALVTGIATSTVATEAKSTSPHSRMRLGGYALLAMGALVWAVLTSPRYVFPAIEVVGRYGTEIIQEKQPVLISEPAMLPLLKSMLRLRGGEETQVTVLRDSAQEMLGEPSWIVWNPTSISHYPRLIKSMDRWKHVYHNASLGFTPPHQWWLMPSAQPVASLIFVGPRGDIDSARSFTQKEQNPRDAILTYSNHAPYTRIKIGRGMIGTEANVADYNYGSVVYWPADLGNAEIQFSLDNYKGQVGPLKLYRMTALPMRSMPRISDYAWKVEGSNDARSWTVIEQRNEEVLSQDGRSPSTYRIENDGSSYRHYRFSFVTPTADNIHFAGIAEIELFFSPTANTRSQ